MQGQCRYGGLQPQHTQAIHIAGTLPSQQPTYCYSPQQACLLTLLSPGGHNQHVDFQAYLCLLAKLFLV